MGKETITNLKQAKLLAKLETSRTHIKHVAVKTHYFDSAEWKKIPCYSIVIAPKKERWIE